MFCKYGACEPFEHWLSCVLVLFVAVFFVVDLFACFKAVCSVLLCTYFCWFCWQLCSYVLAAVLGSVCGGLFPLLLADCFFGLAPLYYRNVR